MWRGCAPACCAPTRPTRPNSKTGWDRCSTAPSRATAREALALAALKRGEFEEAGRLLDQLVVDPATPASMRQRAEALSSLARGAGKFTPPSKAAPPPVEKK